MVSDNKQARPGSFTSIQPRRRIMLLSLKELKHFKIKSFCISLSNLFFLQIEESHQLRSNSAWPADDGVWSRPMGECSVWSQPMAERSSEFSRPMGDVWETGRSTAWSRDSVWSPSTPSSSLDQSCWSSNPYSGETQSHERRLQ